MRGLLIVDVQYDFIEGGSLAVSGGKAVADEIANLLSDRAGYYDKIFASQDWHNPLPDLNGGHFSPEGVTPDFVTTWPVHCVAGTRGARIEAGLASMLTVYGAVPIQKGQGRPDYSAFQGQNPYGLQTLAWELGQAQITDLDIVGIATDHCVYQSALNALDLGDRLREVRVLTDLVAGVDAERSRLALSNLQHRGATITASTLV